MGDIFQPQLTGIHAQLHGQAVGHGLGGEKALSGAKTAECTAGHGVGVGDVEVEMEGLRPAEHGQGLDASKQGGGKGLLAVGAGIGDRMDAGGPDDAVLRGAQLDGDIGLMTGVGGDKALGTGVDQLGRPAGLDGDDGAE